MTKLTYKIDINAPKQKVWDIMLGDKTYTEWTEPFYPGSYFEGSWEKGSEIKFLGADEQGNISGMVARIVENTPYEFVSIEHYGEIKNGEVDTTSEEVKTWAGNHENYTFSEDNGVTHLLVELDAGDNMSQEMKDMFEGMWPKALEKLKEICEK